MATNNALNVGLSGSTGSGSFVGSSAPTLSNVTIDNINISTNTISPTTGNLLLTQNSTNAIALGQGAYQSGNILPVQITATTTAGLGPLAVGVWSNNANPSGIAFVKSRSATPGASGQTIVQNGDGLMDLGVYASNGSGSFTQCADISVAASGTVSGSNIPTVMVFKTMTTGGLLATALTITNAQIATFAAQVSAPSITFGGSALSTYVQNTVSNPVVTFATNGDLSVSYATQSGVYTKIGTQVTYTFALTFTPTYTTSSGNLQISLPFPTYTPTVSAFGSVFVQSPTWPSVSGSLCIVADPNTSVVRILQSRSGTTGAAFGATNFTSGVQYIISGSITYLAQS